MMVLDMLTRSQARMCGDGNSVAPTRSVLRTVALISVLLTYWPSVVGLKFLPELLHARRRNFKSKTTLVSYTC
jgi:hypothetical protein